MRAAQPHGRRAPRRAAGVADTHSCADRRVSAAAGHQSRQSCRRRPGRRHGRCAPRYGRSTRRSAATRTGSHHAAPVARMHTHAMDRMCAPGRDAALPSGDVDAAGRCGLRTRGACRACGRARGRHPFSAVIAHPASMAGFNVSPSATAPVFFPRSEARLSDSDCYRIAAILSARHHAFGLPPHGPRKLQRAAGGQQ
ncbi:hypothetical protein BamMEX5DRAFT_6922 [Burkholderia ambifaria MEX-5]|uniref:Uncharacterized protein n=1 Tax=Burkholderia ambifaria MEX-5 TaxID=396597 RepID=B1TGK6_9BURK|nr:hypothetical protein BamMEX5DRAFT_6922 [Burkholderia ambifaria MEX-5]